MGLVANCFRYQWHGMAEGSAHALLPGSWDSDHQWQKYIAPDMASAVLQTTSNPPGQYLERVWNAPIIVGDMVMRTDGAGDLAGDLIPSYPMSIDMTGSGDMDATAALVIAMAIAMTGSGDLAATIEGRLNMSIDMTGAGDLDAAMSGIASMAIEMLGAGDLDATIAAYGNMEIDIVVTGTGLTTANVGQAVWSALQSQNQDAGTMGEALALAYAMLRNKRILDPSTGVETFYDENGAVLFTRNVFADAAGSTLYDGTAAPHRVERYE